MTICTCERCVLDGFHGCSRLYRSKNGPSALKFFRPCIKIIRRTFEIDYLHITKHGFITMTRRQKLSLSDGYVMTRHLRKRHVSNRLRAKPC